MLGILAIAAAIVFWAAFAPTYVGSPKSTQTWAELSVEWNRIKDEERAEKQSSQG